MAKRKKKFDKATRTYNLSINQAQANTLEIFKKLRPDLHSGQEIMEYANKLFWDKYDDMFLTTYKLLDVSNKQDELDNYSTYKKVLVYRHYFKEYKLVDSKIDSINKRFKIDINKAEYFRRMFLFMLSEYNLFNYMEEQPLLQEMPEDINEFINDLDVEYREKVLYAIKKSEIENNSKENKDDKTLDIENEDDKTLDKENEDDKTLDIENLDDITVAYENIDDFLEYMDDTTEMYENY